MIGSLQTFAKPQAVAFADKFPRLQVRLLGVYLAERSECRECFESPGRGIAFYNWQNLSILSRVAAYLRSLGTEEV